MRLVCRWLYLLAITRNKMKAKKTLKTVSIGNPVWVSVKAAVSEEVYPSKYSILNRNSDEKPKYN